MGWHEEKPTLCDTSHPEKLTRRHRNVSFVQSAMSEPHFSKGPLDRPNGLMYSNPKDSASTTVGSGSFNQDSFNPPIAHNDLNTTPRSRSKKCKRPRVNPNWSSRLVLPPSTSPASSSSHVDLSKLAVGFPPYPPNAWLKRCPACLVPIERVEGCAQMNCRACKHTFCWYCLSSLDVSGVDAFLISCVTFPPAVGHRFPSVTLGDGFRV
ncbi:hypothetical protein FBUS_11670 [Fasciolopsis buskii]|uniref:RBR-type E3 ubiquitin transferase n=1 Tax=Fasciolopsis buskii TaxID=27845 RepID=A0A8E0VEI3_9TREM|nr:hypothetical protein FBUS_11670 [Fasciolopsis buski]